MRLQEFTFGIIVIGIFSITACVGGGHKKSVGQYIASIKAKPATQQLPPLPTVKTYPVPQYDVTQLRSPFQSTMVSKTATQERQREPLEYFSIDSLRFVGVITQNGQKLALIMAPNNKLYQLAVGQYLGQSGGRINAIHGSYIDVIEPSNDEADDDAKHITLKLSTRAAKIPAARSR